MCQHPRPPARGHRHASPIEWATGPPAARTATRQRAATVDGCRHPPGTRERESARARRLGFNTQNEGVRDAAVIALGGLEQAAIASHTIVGLLVVRTIGRIGQAVYTSHHHNARIISHPSDCVSTFSVRVCNASAGGALSTVVTQAGMSMHSANTIALKYTLHISLISMRMCA